MENKILEAINKAYSVQLVELNNRYCGVFHYEHEIYFNDEDFFNTFFQNAGDAYNFARSITNDYKFSHEFVKIDTQEIVHSFDSVKVENLCEDILTMSKYIAKDFDKFADLEIFNDIEIE